MNFFNKNNIMMNQEYNSIFSEKNKFEIEKDSLLNKENFKPELLLNENILNQKEQNITLEEIKKIMNGTKIHLEEDYSEEIYFNKNFKTELQTTEFSTKNSSFSENKEDKFSKIINFITVLRKKRGRKSKNSNNKKLHGSDDFDNIQRKIQVDFISFLIRLANDALKSIFGVETKFHFKHVDYDLKKIVNHNYIEYLKNCNYSDIMKMKISKKNKKFGENANKETFNEVCEYSDKLKKIFDKKYLYIFQKYYCCLTNSNNSIDLEGLKITLSPKTKALFNLLKKNENNKKKFNDVIQDVYFSEVNYILDKRFITSSSEFSKIEQDKKK